MDQPTKKKFVQQILVCSRSVLNFFSKTGPLLFSIAENKLIFAPNPALNISCQVIIDPSKLYRPA
jgi:hypothetical protein